MDEPDSPPPLLADGRKSVVVQTPKDVTAPIQAPHAARPGIPQRIRARLRDSYESRIAFLEDVIDGKYVSRFRVKLKDLRAHLVCAACGSQTITGQGDAKEAQWHLELEAEAQASAKDRLAAMAQLAQYGLGQLTEVSTETVRTKVAETVQAVRKHCDDQTALAIVQEMRRIWT